MKKGIEICQKLLRPPFLGGYRQKIYWDWQIDATQFRLWLLYSWCKRQFLWGYFFEKREGARWLINFGNNARLRIPIPPLNFCVFFTPSWIFLSLFFCHYYMIKVIRAQENNSCSREQIQKGNEHIQNIVKVCRLNYQIFFKVITSEIQNSRSLLFPIFCIKSRPRGRGQADFLRK